MALLRCIKLDTPTVMSVIISDYLRLLEKEEEVSNCPLSDRELDVLKLLVGTSKNPTQNAPKEDT